MKKLMIDGGWGRCRLVAEHGYAWQALFDDSPPPGMPYPAYLSPAQLSCFPHEYGMPGIAMGAVMTYICQAVNHFYCVGWCGHWFQIWKNCG